MQKNTTYHLYRIYLIPILFLALIAPVYAQTTTVSGKIVDAISREPLPFVNIIFKGTTEGGTTDIEGHYTISTTNPIDSIIISYVGYTRITTTQTILFYF